MGLVGIDMRRRTFLMNTGVVIVGVGCISHSKNLIQSSENVKMVSDKYLLGQWTFHKPLKAGKMNTKAFLSAAHSLGFKNVDFVSQFFPDEIDNLTYFADLSEYARILGIQSPLLLIDEAVNLGDADPSKRQKSINQHKKWLNAAKTLGCEAIRINAYGDGSQEELLDRITPSILDLCQYGQERGVDILVENHGGYSSDPEWLIKLYHHINQDNFSILADVDNFCSQREGGSMWNGKCIQWHDRYDALTKLLPYTRSVSLKFFDFDQDGQETNINYSRIMKILQDHNYQGYLGIEYEGDKWSERDGVIKSCQLLDRIKVLRS